MNEKSVVEDALLQIKAVENAISENAKGILASTMKEEISELVRESLGGSKKRSLREQEEQGQEVGVEDEEVDVEEPVDGMEGEEVVVDDETEVVDDGEELPVEPEMGDNLGGELPPLDMTQSSIGDVIKVFKLMGDEDGIIVKKDEKGIHLSDPKNETEYLIQMDGDTENPQNMMENSMIDAIRSVRPNQYENYGSEFNEQEETGFGYDEYGDEGEDYSDSYFDELEEEYGMEEQDFPMEEYGMEEQDFPMEEYGMEEQDFPMEEQDFPMEEQDFPMEEYGMEENVYEIDQEALESVLESFKAKGLGMGKPGNGFSKMSVNDKGFKEDRKSGGKGLTGKGPKFKYPKIKHGVTENEFEEEEFNEWEDETNEELIDTKEQPETTEASRTLGNGKYWGRKGLPKPRTAPRHLRVESVNGELNLLREKNEEYKKALDFFRTKLNEVAVFNSNLAYSTRLFTEHSTTKQEKINILRRFDSVESLKESKNLYQSIKRELDGKGTQPVVTESIQRKVTKTPQSGSATNLIESKTYENPQFMRIKDLMTKIN
jgi:hypothetical protein